MSGERRFSNWRRWRVIGLSALLPAALLLGYGLWLATSTPVVRHLALRAPGWPPSTPPIRIVLATDLHVSDLGASTRRLARVVEQIDGLHPDIILLGGDFVGGSVQDHPEKIARALAPLAGLKARLGSFAVLGNHDHHSDPSVIRQALRAADIRLLSNSATTAGPIVIGGVDDEFTHHARLIPTELSMARRTGFRVIVGHSPDVFPLERLAVPLTLAGHTHCGQIALPWYGAILIPVHFKHYSCGVYREGGRTLIVSSGTGTSQLPIRLFAPPDLWLIEIGPA